MPAWTVVSVPVSLAVLALLLYVTTWLEQRVLSPRSLILRSIRMRGVRPEHVEQFVAAQAEQLLAEQPGQPATRAYASADTRP